VSGRPSKLSSIVSGLLGCGLTLALGCSPAGNDSTVGGGQAGSKGSSLGAGGAGSTVGSGTGGNISLGPLPPADMGGSGGESTVPKAITSLPAGYTATDIGGFQLGGRIDPNAPAAMGGTGSGGAGAGGESMGDCGNVLLAVVRDFKGADEGGHADFEATGIQGADVTPNLVSATLGADKKPTYASQCEVGNAGPMGTCPYGAQTTTAANFDPWFRDAAGVNDAYVINLWFAPRPNGIYTFQSLAYFPIDGAGFMGSAMADDGMMHNFGFTTEIHTQFLYRGAETFTFQGDDDVWVFINNKLAVDVGGLHPMQLRAVQLDAVAAQLGIVPGSIYPLDLFHAERHTTASTFRIDTNLSFVDCGTIIPGKVK
jgi:fibro-slime domain-containing protein